MKYEIDDEFGGVPGGAKYEIVDTPETEKEWRQLLADFSTEFKEFSSQNYRDFELADWHYGVRQTFAYLYNEAFYNEHFIPRVQRVLESQKNECYGVFECFSNSKHLLGHFMVFKDKTVFSRKCEQIGLLRKVIGAG